MKLRYVGTVPTTFITGMVGVVEYGDEFAVSDELASVFLTRSDVEEVVEVAGKTKVFTSRRPNVEPGQSAAVDGDPEKMSEENGGVPDDH